MSTLTYSLFAGEPREVSASAHPAFGAGLLLKVTALSFQDGDCPYPNFFLRASSEALVSAAVIPALVPFSSRAAKTAIP